VQFGGRESEANCAVLEIPEEKTVLGERVLGGNVRKPAAGRQAPPIGYIEHLV